MPKVYVEVFEVCSSWYKMQRNSLGATGVEKQQQETQLCR